MEYNGKRWLLIGGGLVLFGLIWWAVAKFYLTPSTPGLPEPNQKLKVSPQERSQSQELIKKANQIEPPVNGQFSQEKGRRRLELLSKALDKNPLNIELRRRLMQEYADGMGWYKTTLSDSEARKRIHELVKQGFSLQMSWRKRKMLVHEMIETTEDMFGLGNYEARWEIAKENEYSNYWLKILMRRAEHHVDNKKSNSMNLLKNTQKKLQEYHSSTGNSIEKGELFVRFLRSKWLLNNKEYDESLKIVERLLKKFKERNIEGFSTHLGFGLSDLRETRRKILCLTNREEVLKSEFYNSQSEKFGDNVSEWPKTFQKIYENPCRRVLD